MNHDTHRGLIATQQNHFHRLRRPPAGCMIDIEAKMKVLIVDDSVPMAQRLKSSLEEVAGLEVVGLIENVADAILEIRRLRPDAVVLDFRMPDGSGIDVLESLKKHPSPPIVVMLSGYDYPQFRRKCLQSGARFYFDKATEFHRVAEVLRDLNDVPVV
jgi:DNA-binding NarL/FixJ family response regulator